MATNGVRRTGLRRVLTGLITLCLVLAGANAQAYTPPVDSPFTDVATTDPAYTEIAWMWDEGISTGWDDKTYRPTQQVDRDAMAAFFYRYKQSPAFTAPTSPCFTDITTSTQFYKEMCWMKSEAISTGWPDGTYRPWTLTYRDAMSAFLYRVAGSPNYTPPTTSPFSDITPTTQFYKEMTWLAENGIATGVEDGTFDPWIPVTRSMMATFMYRLANPGPVELRVVTSALPAAVVGVPYSASLASFGGTAPVTWSATGLPAWASLSPDGQLSGTPTAPAPAAPVAFTVTDATSVTASANLSVEVRAFVDPLSITTTVLPGGVTGTPYSVVLAAQGGIAPYTWSATGLPSGLSISSDGRISGTPTAVGNRNVAITVTDASNTTSTTTLAVTVIAPLSVVTNSLPTSVAGIPYGATVSAQGGVPPYQWSATGLPAGLSISSSGQISGTPSTAATSSVQVTVRDSAGKQASRTLSLTISATNDCDVLRCIALTFDDGPDTYSDTLLNALTRAKAKATFFDVGSQVRANPAPVTRKANAGMEIGVHGWDHIDYSLMTYGYSLYDFNAAASAIEDATGDWPTLSRPPYGFYDNDVINAAGDAGLATVLWTDNTWDYEYTDANSLRWDTLDLASRNSVMLMHDGVPATASAIANIIADLQAEGYTLVTVSTLMGGDVETHVVHFEV